MNSDLRIVAPKKKYCRNGLRLLSPPRLNFAETINDFIRPTKAALPMQLAAQKRLYFLTYIYGIRELA
jgi:hypothetical protein